jgi:hypothetical protein
VTDFLSWDLASMLQIRSIRTVKTVRSFDFINYSLIAGEGTNKTIN